MIFHIKSETLRSPAPYAQTKKTEMKFYYNSEILMSFNWKLFCRLSCDDILFKVLFARFSWTELKRTALQQGESALK